MDRSITYLTQEQHKRRNELGDRLIGELNPEPPAEPIAEVAQRTGIRPPAWFNTRGVTMDQVQTIGAVGRARR